MENDYFLQSMKNLGNQDNTIGNNKYLQQQNFPQKTTKSRFANSAMINLGIGNKDTIEIKKETNYFLNQQDNLKDLINDLQNRIGQIENRQSNVRQNKSDNNGVGWDKIFDDFNKAIRLSISKECVVQGISEDVNNNIQKFYSETIERALINPKDSCNIIYGALKLNLLYIQGIDQVDELKKQIVLSMKSITSSNSYEKLTEEPLEYLAKNIVNNTKFRCGYEEEENIISEGTEKNVKTDKEEKEHIENNNKKIENQQNNEEISEKSSQKQELEISKDEEMELLYDKLKYNDEELKQQKREEEENRDFDNLEILDLEQLEKNQKTLENNNESKEKEIEQNNVNFSENYKNNLQLQKQEENLQNSQNLEVINLEEEDEKENNKNEENIQRQEQIEINEQQNQNNIEENNPEIEMTEQELNNVFDNFTPFNTESRNQRTMVKFDKVMKNINSRWGIVCLFSRKARLENILHTKLVNSGNNTISLDDLNEIIVQSAGCGCG